MGLIKFESEIGKTRADKYIIYYLWWVVKFCFTLPIVFRKESQIPAPKIFKISLLKLVTISSFVILIPFAGVMSPLQLDPNNGLLIFCQMILVVAVVLLAIFVCLYTAFYIFRFWWRMMETLVDTILIFRGILKERDGVRRR